MRCESGACIPECFITAFPFLRFVDLYGGTPECGILTSGPFPRARFSREVGGSVVAGRMCPGIVVFCRDE